MMKRLLPMVLLLSSLFVAAEGPSRWRGGPRNEAGGPWLGVNLSRMEKSTAAQLKDVPVGFGLLVEEVVPDSPAAAVGLQPLDILWKYDDQLIANQGQLYALMKHTGLGNEAQLTFSRAGESLGVVLTIGQRPAKEDDLVRAAHQVLMPPIPGDVVRQLDLGKRSGFISEGPVTVSLAKAPNGYYYMVSEAQEVKKEGILAGPEEALWPLDIDANTRQKLQALFQSLLNAEEREDQARPLPRVRRVPVPDQKN